MPQCCSPFNGANSPTLAEKLPNYCQKNSHMHWWSGHNHQYRHHHHVHHLPPPTPPNPSPYAYSHPCVYSVRNRRRNSDCDGKN